MKRRHGIARGRGKKDILKPLRFPRTEGLECGERADLNLKLDNYKSEKLKKWMMR